MLLSISLAALSLVGPVAQTPSELVAALDGADSDAALRALVTKDPAEAMPPLISCLQSGAPEHAWQAGRAVQQLYVGSPKHKVWTTAVPDVLKVTLDKSSPGPNRVIAAISIRGAEKASKKLIGDLTELLGDNETPSELRMALTLSCGQMGKTGAKSLKRQLNGKGMMKMVWATTAAACMGKAGSALKKRLTDLIVDEESLTAFVACRSNLLALERVAGERATEKPLKKRLSKSRGKTWRGGGGGINFGGIVPMGPKYFFGFFDPQTGKRVRDIEVMSLPDDFDEPMNGSLYTIADALQGFTLHVTEETLLLDARLSEDAITTWKEWESATKPLLLLVDFLDEMDEKILN